MVNTSQASTYSSTTDFSRTAANLYDYYFHNISAAERTTTANKYNLDMKLKASRVFALCTDMSPHRHVGIASAAV